MPGQRLETSSSAVTFSSDLFETGSVQASKQLLSQHNLDGTRHEIVGTKSVYIFFSALKNFLTTDILNFAVQSIININRLVTEQLGKFQTPSSVEHYIIIL